MARQLCGMHYQRFWKHGDPLHEAPRVRRGSNEERFWSYVQRGEGCWIWTGGRHLSRGGYGQFHFYVGPGETRNVLAHRYSAQLAGMDIDSGFVCHHCDNPKCVRPDHLFIGSHEENMRDMAQKGRAARVVRTHCRHGHPFTPENTVHLKSGKRLCRECSNARSRKHRAAVTR
jgi:HNH endonuclease